MNQNRRLCLTRRIASGVAACSLGVFPAAGAPVQVLAASPQFAYSTEKWASLQDDKLEFDEIADRIHEYNSTVGRRTGSSTRIIRAKTAMRSRRNIMTRQMRSRAVSSTRIRMMRIMVPHWQQHRSEASATRMREQGDNNVDDANVKAWGYTQTEKSLVQQAQNLMIQYWNAQENLKSVQNQGVQGGKRL